MIQTAVDPLHNLVTMTAKGELTTEDYGKITPELEKLIGEHGKLNLLFDMSGVKNIEPAAAWQDLKFDTQHLNDFKRVALVGDAGWQEAFTKLGNPFTKAEVKYFSSTAEATDWLGQALGEA